VLTPFLFSETSPAAAGTAASSKPVQNTDPRYGPGIAFPLDDVDAVDVVVTFGGNTGGSLDVYVQINPDGQGKTWVDIIHFPTAASGTGALTWQAPISNNTTTNAPFLVGTNLNPALQATNPNVVNGAFSERMRLVMVSGIGTSAGTTVTAWISGQRRWNRQYG
jgi:hypothetical protein